MTFPRLVLKVTGAVARCTALLLLLTLLLTPTRGLFAADTPGQNRIISLDYCADQYVLMLAPRGDILALSREATSAVSHFKDRAQGIRQIRPDADLILSLKPSLVVSSFPRHQDLMTLLDRANIKTLIVPYAANFDSQQNHLQMLANRFNQHERGKEITQARAKKRQLVLSRQKNIPAIKALYLTPGGYTTGRGTGMHTLFKLAGIGNMLDFKKGWLPVPLEHLIVQPPTTIITSFYDDPEMATSPWGLAHHDAVNTMINKARRIDVPSHLMACNGLFNPAAADFLQQKILAQ